MLAYVYSSRRKPGTYVYLRQADAFELLPEPLRTQMGPLRHVLDVALTPERTLAQVDPALVRANLAAQGFHIQFPPNEFADAVTERGDG